LAWPGLAWPGLAWLGLAWLGLAWLGLAWLGLACPGLARLGLAWLGRKSSFGSTFSDTNQEAAIHHISKETWLGLAWLGLAANHQSEGVLFRTQIKKQPSNTSARKQHQTAWP
jgi:hypothetical protein